MTEREFEWLLKLQFSQTPPLVLGFLAVNTRELYSSRDYLEMLGVALFGVATWALGALVLAAVVQRRFRRLTHRGTFLSPDSRGPKRPQQQRRPSSVRSEPRP
jgi:hypothetical protein